VAIERSLRRSERGFTLIEVLVAMVILAVGLMGLQALGIGASRMVTRAERQSEYTVQASRALEATLDSLRRGSTPATSAQWVSAGGDTIRRTITTTGKLRSVRVAVRPNRSRPARPDTFSIISDVFLP
jgi:prepilin-type N-terminal cleavage/methylation domain-containing protein